MWRLRAPVALLALAALLGSFVAGTDSAQADTAPPDSSLPQTVAADSLPTGQINGVVWSQVIVGDTVFIGREFSRARPAGAAAGTSEVSRNNLFAYSLTTGVMTAFDPNLKGAVRAITTAPDGSRIYVGGAFTKAGTQAKTRLAAFDTASGALVPTLETNRKRHRSRAGSFRGHGLCRRQLHLSKRQSQGEDCLIHGCCRHARKMGSSGTRRLGQCPHGVAKRRPGGNGRVVHLLRRRHDARLRHGRH